jgi:hypothetical protein
LLLLFSVFFEAGVRAMHLLVCINHPSNSYDICKNVNLPSHAF